VLLGSAVVCVVVFYCCLLQVHEAGLQRARLAADKAAADDKVAATAARLPEAEAEKKAAAAKKVRTWCTHVESVVGTAAIAVYMWGGQQLQLPEVAAEKTAAAANKVRGSRAVDDVQKMCGDTA
jgi:hypothetical protein